MDKRSILFVICVTATLFLVKLLFGYWETQQAQEWYEQQRALRAKQIEQQRVEIAERTEPLKNLPVARVYADVEQKDFLATAIVDGPCVLLLSWTEFPPEKIYVAVKEGSAPKEMQLLAGIKDYTQPLLYGEKGDSRLQTGRLHELGRFDLQMVQLSDPPQVVLGQYVDSRLTLLSNELLQDAIALVKQGDDYLPVAIYHRETQQLTLLENLPAFKSFLAKPAEPVADKSKEEKFYVLENSFQQLVFSNRGGAIAEINLPFQSEENPSSVIRKIAFDQEMVEQDPDNARFPSHPYTTPDNKDKELQGKLGGYYPLLRRDIVGKGGRSRYPVKPQYYAFNIVSEYPEVAQLIYEVKTFEANRIVFESIQPHRRITKTYTLEPGVQGAPYCLLLEIKIEGDGRGLWLTSGVPDVELLSGTFSPALKYRFTRQNKVEVESISLPKDSETIISLNPDWICNSNGFLGVIVDPLTEMEPGYMAQTIAGVAMPSRLIEIGKQYETFTATEFPGYQMLLPFKKQGGNYRFRLFAGPFAEETLKAVDAKYSDPATGYTPDYIACQSFHGWFSFISEPFAKFLMILMKFFYFLTHSWAASIILLTVALRVMLYPLNSWSMKSMRRMQQIAPEITKIQEKHKKDPKKGQMEIMNLYRTRGINPLTGCFPMLIQLPFLIGMFDLLKSTFELRGASFIPGWIDNLTAPDVLFSWQTPIPFIGNEFHLLPLLLGVVMFIQQRWMSTAPTDASLMTDQQRQQRAMGTLMPIMFTVMFYKVASGLNIYWLSSMILGILQQWWVNRGKDEG